MSSTGVIGGPPLGPPIGVIGGGLMGSGISLVNIQKDIKTRLKDLNQESLGKSEKYIWSALNKRVKRKALSSFDNLIVSGFSNGHNAYLPTTEAYEEGGYEVDVTPFSPGSDQLAVSACLNAVSLVE